MYGTISIKQITRKNGGLVIYNKYLKEKIKLETQINSKKRIESIDILRGIVMIIMALDHARDYLHFNGLYSDPLDLTVTTPSLFFTRWITHFCAPTFIFLSGLSAYLQSLRKTKKELSIFLIKRGLWLILLEITVNTFTWSFNPFYNLINMQVLWAIGVSMIILGLLVRLPYKIILIVGLLIVFGHNLMDIPEARNGFDGGFLWNLMHHEFLFRLNADHYIDFFYPFLPWTGVMIMGYCIGVFFSTEYSTVQRRKILLQIGAGLLLFFVVLRFSNVYGDPVRWTTQKNLLYTIFSFVKVNKYPPSLLYICLTIGVACLLLAYFENIENKVTGIFRTFGRTAFFYYLLHMVFIHSICAVLFFTRGHSLADAYHIDYVLGFPFVLPNEGYSLGVVYFIWLAVVAALYPLCKWYDKYKTSHKEKWWLSYL